MQITQLLSFGFIGLVIAAPATSPAPTVEQRIADRAKTYGDFDKTASLRLATADVYAQDASSGASAVDKQHLMKWTGEVFPGKNYTFYGDAQGIHDTIHTINPNYVPKHLPDGVWAESGGQKRSLSPRNPTNSFCGHFATSRVGDAHNNDNYLAGLGGQCQVAANSCVRMACTNSGGAYFCNDNNYAIGGSCSYLANNYLFQILGACEGPTDNDSLSGQLFDSGNWNIITAYAVCSDSSGRRPGSYSYPGPNGNPYRTCTNCFN